MKKLYILILPVFALLLIINEVRALEKLTHYSLNGTIVNQSGLDNYLKTNLGFSDGIKEIINSKRVNVWIQEGGKAEDEPFYTRSFNHFHNPLLPWDSAGYGGTFKSALLWAQDQGSFGSLFGGNYSWKAVRDYYYLGLTSSAKTDREKNLADTFRGLGQLMHLVEDMSVPAHTRNDGHLLYNYENWVLEMQYNDQPKFSAFISNPIFYGGSIANISNLFDTDQYNGTNPNIAVGNTIGLSEYANANFFSEDTMFTFTYPSKNTSVQVVDYDYPDPFNAGNYVKRQYYKKVADGETGLDANNDGIPDGYRLAGVDYLKLYRDATLSSAEADQIMVISPMDEYVYSDYASLLLPRAVGYSAGLLNYFFRGKLAFVREGINKFRIKNMYSEPLESGNYTLAYDDRNYNRRILASFNLSTRLNQYELTDSIYFSPPTDNITSGRYMAIFKGKLGQEDGAVIGNLSQERIAFDWALNIFLMTPDENNMLRLREGRHPAISPDGAKVAFVIGNGELWLFEMETKTSRRLSTGYYPTWSPDGNQIAFCRGDNLFSINLITYEERQLTYGIWVSGFTAWSPDGTKIAFKLDLFNIGFVDSNGNYLGPLFADGNYIIKLSDGTEIRRDVTGKVAWSPDGTQLAFEMCRYGCETVGGIAAAPTIFNTYLYNFNSTMITDLSNIDKTKYKPGDYIRVIPHVWSAYNNDLYVHYYIYINETDTVVENNLWVLSTGGGGLLRNITLGGAFLSNTTQY